MRRIFDNVILAEDWTPGKQIISVIFLFVLLVPVVLLYLFKGEIVQLLKALFS